MNGFSEVLEREGLRGTFYVIQSEFDAHAAMYRDLETRGHEIGLHLHSADQDYQPPDMKLDYWDQTADTCAGFDRLGRVVQQLWRAHPLAPSPLDMPLHKYAFTNSI